MDDAALRAEMEKYTFYHTIELAEGITTPGWPTIVPVVAQTLDAMRALDLRDKRVLEVGCGMGWSASRP